MAILTLMFLSGATQTQTALKIRSFGEIVEVVSHVSSFHMTWSNGDETLDIHVSCPDRISQTTINDVGSRTASISIGKDVWESREGISGPWVRRRNAKPQELCGSVGLVFPAELDLKSAERGKLAVESQVTCEEWLVRTKKKTHETAYTYCIGTDKLPVRRSIGQVPYTDYATFSEWNRRVNITAPKNPAAPK